MLGMVLTFWKCSAGEDVTSLKSRSVGTSNADREVQRPALSDAPVERRKKSIPQKVSAAGTPLTAGSGRAHSSMKGARPKSRLPTTLSDSHTSPWSSPGQCVGAKAQGDRILYFSMFIESGDLMENASANEKGSARLWVYPNVSQEAVSGVSASVRAAESLAGYFKKGLARPDVYIHESVEQLREHACVAASALSYYDGAIHIAALEESGEMAKSVFHEYAHHLLVELGLRRPIWLHEGFAQWFAHESNGSKPSSRVALDQAMMAAPLSTASTQEELAAFYDQASDMLDFLSKLRGGGGYKPVIDELTQALAEGITDAEGLFIWATTEHGRNVFTGDAEKFWAKYLEDGGFDAETLGKIEEERGTGSRHKSP
jgi:hypothetical protein